MADKMSKDVPKDIIKAKHESDMKKYGLEDEEQEEDIEPVAEKEVAQAKNITIDEFGRDLPIKTGNRYLSYLVVDNVLFHKSQILLITRKEEPCLGCLALPGGYVEYNEEPTNSCLRELREECTVDGEIIDLIGVYGKPLRDPRHHTISIAYLVKPKVYNNSGNFSFEAGDDAANATFYNVDDLLHPDSPNKLAFDHYQIIKKGWHMYKKLKK